MEFARVRRVDTSPYKRVIAVSDIHGNGHLLKLLLSKLAFSTDDALFLLGDFIEKGKHSLETVRQVMELCRAGNAFALQGNCDTLWDDLAAGLYNVDENTYMNWRKDSLLCDMCAELSLERGRIGSAAVRRELEAHYADVFAWLRALPHIIDTDFATFVHAGLDGGALEMQDAERCVKREAFLEERLCFEKTVVCGHIPTSNYFHLTGGRLSYAPLQAQRENIVCIDGGNAVKSSGQLNAFVFDGAKRYFIHADDLPEISVCERQEGAGEPASVAWNHREVEPVERRTHGTLCRVCFTGKLLEIPDSMLFYENETLCSYDYTDYRLPLEPGDRVKLLQSGETDSLVKHEGVLGWAKTAILTHR